MNNAIAKIVTLKSRKTGKEFEALEFRLDDYTTLAFPSRLELKYLKKLLADGARKDFKKELENDADEQLFD